MKVGIISDTHGYLDDRIMDYLGDCDQIWHAGDIGSVEVMDRLSPLATSRFVYGNIDGNAIRIRCPEYQFFMAEGLAVYMIHIGGYPGKYQPGVRHFIEDHQPGLFISGHSHILKIMPDHKHNLIHINPGAAGRNGLHKMRTIALIEIEAAKITDAKVIELGKRSAL